MATQLSQYANPYSIAQTAIFLPISLVRDEYEALRHSVIDMVLATEMAKHFEHLQKFIHIFKAHMKPVADDDMSVKVWKSQFSDAPSLGNIVGRHDVLTTTAIMCLF